MCLTHLPAAFYSLRYLLPSLCVTRSIVVSTVSIRGASSLCLPCASLPHPLPNRAPTDASPPSSSGSPSLPPSQFLLLCSPSSGLPPSLLLRLPLPPFLPLCSPSAGLQRVLLPPFPSCLPPFLFRVASPQLPRDCLRPCLLPPPCSAQPLPPPWADSCLMPLSKSLRVHAPGGVLCSAPFSAWGKIIDGFDVVMRITRGAGRLGSRSRSGPGQRTGS